MTNGNGTIILNGISDAELITILQVKEKHEASLDFTPQAMQPQQIPANQPGAGKKFYSQVKLDWRTDNGLKAVFQIVEHLLGESKHEQKP